MGKSLQILILIFSIIATVAFAQTTGKDADESGQSERFVENEVREVRNPLDFYPNPVGEYLNITIKDRELRDVDFEIYNIIGNSIKVEVEEVANYQYKIPVRTLNPGYYLLIVNDKDNRFKQAYKFQKK